MTTYILIHSRNKIKLTLLLIITLFLTSCSLNNIVKKQQNKNLQETNKTNLYDLYNSKKSGKKIYVNTAKSHYSAIVMGGSIDSSGVIAGGAVGAAGGIYFLPTNFKNILSDSDRTYHDANYIKIYNYIISNLRNKKYVLEKSDIERGLILSKYELGIYKKILWWEWRKIYLVMFELSRNEINKNEVLFKVILSPMKKTPLSRMYSPDKNDNKSIEEREQLIRTIDNYVKKIGGGY